jgi:peptidoglycan hydrolase CwlO-like protein
MHLSRLPVTTQLLQRRPGRIEKNIVKELEDSNKRLKIDKELLISERVKLEESNTRLNSDKEELKNTINQLNSDKIHLAGKKEELKENNKELLAEVRLL